jgi:hypothetical protein
LLFCATSTNYNVHASALDGASKSQTEYFDTNYKLILTSLSGKMWPKTFIPFLDKLNRFLKIKLFPAVLGLLKYCFSASQSGKYSVTLHFRSKVRFCGNNSEFSPATNRAASGVTFNSLSELEIFSVD